MIVGCGLLGTSFALALRSVQPACVIDGVEIDESHRQGALAKGVFDSVSTDFQNRTYDLLVLAVSIDTACSMLPDVHSKASIILDLCSIKNPICKEAERLGLQERFAPTHPMAGAASEGPLHAYKDMFQGHPWVCIDGWSACETLKPLFESFGSNVVTVATAARHDEAMAAVSHAIHLISLSAMLAYDYARQTSKESDAAFQLASLTGPGFRDITRLSASPSGFWVSTLLQNQEYVTRQLDEVIRHLEGFRASIAGQDRVALQQRLDDARSAHQKWKGEVS